MLVTAGTHVSKSAGYIWARYQCSSCNFCKHRRILHCLFAVSAVRMQISSCLLNVKVIQFHERRISLNNLHCLPVDRCMYSSGWTQEYTLSLTLLLIFSIIQHLGFTQYKYYTIFQRPLILIARHYINGISRFVSEYSLQNNDWK